MTHHDAQNIIVAIYVSGAFIDIMIFMAVGFILAAMSND